MMGIIKLQERRVNPEIIMAEAADIDSSISKDEIYVDSRAWLGSDTSEDDYHSVDYSTPCSPARRRMCIKNLYYNNNTIKHMIPPPAPPPASAMTVRTTKKPLVELLKDPYWVDEQQQMNMIKEGKRQMRLVEFFLEDSFFWEKEFSLTSSPDVAVGNGKRVLKDEPVLDHGCCLPVPRGFWSKKRKTKAAVS
ncbi:hypothetical protein LINGRAHAP2_LOCUS21566 [Linum grandiflorum]